MKEVICGNWDCFIKLLVKYEMFNSFRSINSVNFVDFKLF